MNHLQKSIVITLAKIYNWGKDHQQGAYSFIFYSVATNTVLLKKQVKIKIANNQFIINSSLRISYTSQENQIKLIMQKVQDHEEEIQVTEQNNYNQFLINLDLLYQNKVQYLAFKKNDKVLKIVEGSNQQENKGQFNQIYPKRRLLKGNDKFIKEKQQFLRKINLTNSNVGSDRKSGNGKVRFIQNLWNLLQEVKYIRSQNRIGIQQQPHYQFVDSMKEQFPSSYINRQRLEKSLSQSDLKNIKKVQSDKSNISKKYKIYPKFKLNIKSLNVQPYDLQNILTEQEMMKEIGKGYDDELYNYLQNEEDYVIDPQQY